MCVGDKPGLLNNKTRLKLDTVGVTAELQLIKQLSTKADVTSSHVLLFLHNAVSLPAAI